MDAIRQGQGAQSRDSQRRLADENSVQPQQRNDQWGELVRERAARCNIPGTGIEMGDCYATGKPLAGSLQCVAHVTEQKQIGWRNAIRVGREAPLTDIDLAVRKEFAKMIIGPTITKT
jgi:hypothetical protein